MSKPPTKETITSVERERFMQVLADRMRRFRDLDQDAMMQRLDDQDAQISLR